MPFFFRCQFPMGGPPRRCSRRWWMMFGVIRGPRNVQGLTCARYTDVFGELLDSLHQDVSLLSS